jgi:hypothetical protein
MRPVFESTKQEVKHLFLKTGCVKGFGLADGFHLLLADAVC